MDAFRIFCPQELPPGRDLAADPDFPRFFRCDATRQQLFHQRIFGVESPHHSVDRHRHQKSAFIQLRLSRLPREHGNVGSTGEHVRHPLARTPCLHIKRDARMQLRVCFRPERDDRKQGKRPRNADRHTFICLCSRRGCTRLYNSIRAGRDRQQRPNAQQYLAQHTHTGFLSVLILRSN